MIRTYFLPVLFSCLAGSMVAQHTAPSWLKHVQQNPSTFGLQPKQVQHLRLSDAYHSVEGLQYIYIQQQYAGIDIDQALLNMVVDAEGQVVHLTHRFVDQDELKASSVPLVTAKSAIERTAHHLGLFLGSLQPALQTRSLPHLEAFTTAGSDEPIETRLLYFFDGAKLILVREVQLLEADHQHYWRVLVDATSGAILKKYDQIVNCSFDAEVHHHQVAQLPNLPFNNSPPPFAMESYLVYPLYTESPQQGQQKTVINPADALASPYGWHDVDGIPGAEYTDTRGNNATVQEDLNANDGPGEKSEGGQDLNFSYAVNFERTPDANLRGSMTNTFYWINLNHDIFYQYGFDENAGNFQVNNYGNGGLANDAVVADVQDGRETNNARFYTYPDGRSGRMELYLWGDEQGLLQASNLSGENISIIGVESGFSENNKLAGKGPVYAPLIQVLDQDGNHLACRNLSVATNASDIRGKIVLVDRGECLFIEKVHYMQTLGALAVIMVNNVAGPAITMGGEGDNITIPAIMVTLEEGNKLRQWMTQGEITVALQKYLSTTNLDSGLDNLIITHEYGHGISTRLAGGPSVNSCLNNDEQMGEGWSDYFGLMLTTQWNTAQPDQRRGIGTWLTRQGINGTGIRPYPYSYDLTVNKLKYSDLPDMSIPHGVGSVWASMLWDMTWEIIAQEGVSPDIYRGQGGNNIALQLVIDGLKLQPCSPGFADGRDAILQADKIRYAGRHQYAIWKAFARRGLGFSASQGSPSSTTDGKAGFDIPSTVLTKTENFTAKDSINRIILSWVAIQEVANKEYLLERSADGKNYAVIATLEGLQFSYDPRSLVFQDLEVNPGVLYYYRLKQVSTGGTQLTVGEATALILEVEDMAVFPNPSSGLSHLVVNSRFHGPAQILVYNLAGQRLKFWAIPDAEILHHRYALDLRDLTEAFLMVQVITPQEKRSVKLILMH